MQEIFDQVAKTRREIRQRREIDSLQTVDVGSTMPTGSFVTALRRLLWSRKETTYNLQRKGPVGADFFRLLETDERPPLKGHSIGSKKKMADMFSKVKGGVATVVPEYSSSQNLPILFQRADSAQILTSKQIKYVNGAKECNNPHCSTR